MATSTSPLAPNAALRWDVVHSLLSDLRPTSVLEIGCGQGAFGARIAAMSTYVGLELDPTSYAVARPRIEANGGRAVNGSWNAIEEDGQFDVVCAFEVLEHLADDVEALSQWRQLMRPEGTLLISVPAGPERFGSWDRLVGHYRRYSSETMAAALASAGLMVSRTVMYGWPLAYVLEAARNRIAVRRGDPLDDGAKADESMAERSAGSGRLLQPKALGGAAVSVGVAPFVVAQRLRKDRGTGLVVAARRSSPD
jgi:SAM-dependent methyltransferase